MPKPPNEYRNAFAGDDVDAGIAELMKDARHLCSKDVGTHWEDCHKAHRECMILKLASCIESLSKDAERYDFVKACCTVEYEGESIEDDAHLDRLRSAIDKAIGS